MSAAQREIIDRFNLLMRRAAPYGLVKDRCPMLRPKDAQRCVLRVGHEGKHLVDPERKLGR